MHSLLEHAANLGGPLFEKRVLGQLDGLLEIYGLGAASERVLASDIQQRGSGLQQMGLMDIVIMVFFLGGILLAGGLVAGICYGTCQGTRDASLEVKPSTTPKTAPKAKRKDKGTLEERQSLAALADEDEANDEVAVTVHAELPSASVPTRCMGEAAALSEALAAAACVPAIREEEAAQNGAVVEVELDAVQEQATRARFGMLDGLD